MLHYLLNTIIGIYVLERRLIEVLSTFNANASSFTSLPMRAVRV